MTTRSMLVGAMFGLIVLSIAAITAFSPDGPAPDAPDRNVPGATTGAGRNTVN